MKMNQGTCLLCFSVAKVLDIKYYTHLQNIYEKLSDHEIQADSHPLCYICYAKLLQWEQLLKQIQKNKSASQPEVRPLVQLCVINTDDWSLPKNSAEIKLNSDNKEECVRHSFKHYLPTARRVPYDTIDKGLPHARQSTRTARNYCEVDGCKSQKSLKKFSFFSLPRDEQRRCTWLEIIGRPDLLTRRTKSTSHFVCSLHFDQSMIWYKPQLRPDAVPTKPLQNQESTSNHNRNEYYKNASTQTKQSFSNVLSVATIKGPDKEPPHSCQSTRTVRNYCAVDGCRNQKLNKKLSFFSLPRDEERRCTWLEIIGRPDLLTRRTKSNSHFVCSLHFDKSMIWYKPQLRPDAVPTKPLQNQQSTSNHNTHEDFKNVSTQTKESFSNVISVATIKGSNKKSSCVQITLDHSSNNTTQATLSSDDTHET